MKPLGAILAGGKSSRFGSDKALAIADGLPLLDHVVMGMYRSADQIVISGREWRDFDVVMDEDHAGEGPLAGLLAVLRHAETNGFDGVLTAPCDALPVPDLTQLIGENPAVIDGYWLFGFWPVALARLLAHHFASQPDRSVRRWLDVCGARRVEAEVRFWNFNSRADISAYEATLEAHA